MVRLNMLWNVFNSFLATPLHRRMRGTLTLAALCLSSFALAAPTLESVTVNPTTVQGGASATGTVTISAAAPTGGMTFILISNRTAAKIPASVTVSAGQTSATFPISTSIVDAATTATITCKLGSVFKQADLAINPLLVTSVGITPSSLIEGDTATGSITVSDAALKGGRVIKLTSNSPAISVPTTVNLVQGKSTASFAVTSNRVNAQTTAQITATLGTSSASTTVMVSQGVSYTFALNTFQTAGGSDVWGQINLAFNAPAGGVSFNVASSNGVATVPATVTVPAGKPIIVFVVHSSTVLAATPTTISVSTGGQTKTASLTVSPPALSSFGLNLGLVAGGTTVTGRVTLNGPAPTGGVTVNVTSDSPFASAPATVAIAAGQSVATFTITTSGATTKTVANLTAACGGTKQTARLMIGAFELSNLILNNASVIGGASVSASVQINAPAPAGGVVVTLGSNNPSVTVPATVMVPEGSSSAPFSIGTSPVASQVKAAISASYGGRTQYEQLIVNTVALSTITLSPTSVSGGQTSTGTITLNGPAPAGGFDVSLRTSSSTTKVPAKVTVPAGQTSVTFTITTVKVKADTSVQVSASLGQPEFTVSLTVTK